MLYKTLAAIAAGATMLASCDAQASSLRYDPNVWSLTELAGISLIGLAIAVLVVVVVLGNRGR